MPKTVERISSDDEGYKMKLIPDYIVTKDIRVCLQSVEVICLELRCEAVTYIFILLTMMVELAANSK